MKKLMSWIFFLTIHASAYAQQHVPTQAKVEDAGLLHHNKADWQPAWGNGLWKLPETGRGAVIFRASVPEQANPKAFNDIHVYFSDQPGKGRNYPMYELVFGGWGNTQSEIRMKCQGPGLPIAQGFPIAIVDATHSHGRAGSPNNDRAWYWAMVDKNTGYIAFGNGSIVGQNVSHIVKHDDPMLANVQYVGFSGWNVPIEYNDVQILPLETADSAIVYGTGNDFIFHEEWKLREAGNGLIRFQALAHEEISVLLSPKNAYDDNHYHIILGGAGNTKNVLIKNGQEVFAEQKRGIAHPGQLRDYYIKVDAKAQKITVGQGRYPQAENVIFEVGDAQFNAAVQYIGLRSGTHLATNYYNINVRGLHERGHRRRDAKAEEKPEATATASADRKEKKAKKKKKKAKKKAKKAKKKKKKGKKKKKKKNKKSKKKKKKKRKKKKAKKKGKKKAKKGKKAVKAE